MQLLIAEDELRVRSFLCRGLGEEGFAVRLENDVLIREGGNLDLMANIPIEADEIEELMNRA